MVNKSGKYLFSLLLVGVWLTGAVLARAQNQTLEGTLSNTHCGLKHSKASAADAKCVNSCVANMGAKYALVVGDKLYTLDGGAKADMEKLAGLSAKVTGQVDGMTIHVASIAPGTEAPAQGSGMGCM